MSAKASDIAKYILEEHGDKTGYQLQKILYYCQAWHVVSLDTPLFSEAISAWEHGPVVREVASQHRFQWNVTASDISGSAENISPRSKVIIDAVLDSYGMLSGDQLEELTHKERPWLDSFNGYSGAAAAPISVDLIKRYYAMLSAMDAEARAKHHTPSIPDATDVYVTDEDYAFIAELLNED